MHKDTPLYPYIIGWISLIFGSLTLNDWAIIIGMFATIFGFIVTWFYRHLEYKLRKKQAESLCNEYKLKK